MLAQYGGGAFAHWIMGVIGRGTRTPDLFAVEDQMGSAEPTVCQL